jgi:hypothetical protein
MNRPLVFISYAKFDDEFEHGALSRFRDELSRTLRFVSGGEVAIFQEGTGIEIGQPVQERIVQSLNETMVFVPIVTPSFFNDPTCRNMLASFLEREHQLGRNDLVLAVYYQHVPALDQVHTTGNPLMHDIAQRHPLDWRPLRGKDFSDPQVRRELERLARRIVVILDKLRAVQQAESTILSPNTQHMSSGREQSSVSEPQPMPVSSEQLELLGRLIEADKRISPSQPFNFAILKGNDEVKESYIRHPGLSVDQPVSRRDLDELIEARFLRRSTDLRDGFEFDITNRGFSYYDQRMIAPLSRAAQIRKQALETQLDNLAHDLQAEYQRLSATPPGADYERIRRSINLIEQEMKRAEEELAQLR